jgi:hypothetical protein
MWNVRTYQSGKEAKEKAFTKQSRSNRVCFKNDEMNETEITYYIKRLAADQIASINNKN